MPETSQQSNAPFESGSEFDSQFTQAEPKGAVDYYEFLQISPNADVDTIHRVYRFLAARFHPDNPASGDAERFRLLTTAYDVLSDRVRRAELRCRAQAAKT